MVCFPKWNLFPFRKTLFIVSYTIVSFKKHNCFVEVHNCSHFTTTLWDYELFVKLLRIFQTFLNVEVVHSTVTVTYGFIQKVDKGHFA